MPSSVIGALRVELGLDSAQFDSGATDAERRAAKLAYNLGVALRKPIDAAVSLKGAIAGIAAGVSITAFAAATQRAFDYSDAIVDLADRTGASTKAIQEFRYAAQLSGSSVEAADQALEKFARTQGLAQAGSDAQVKLFRELGVTSKDFDVALRQTMDGLAKLPTVQQRNATALQIFGKSAGTLTALLSQGSAGFNELAGEAEKLGIVLGDDLLRNAGQANDTLDRMKMIVNAQFAGVVAANATSITSLAVSIGQLAGSVIKFMSTNPEKALGIIGAIAGGRLAGLPGALAGGSVGLLAGAYQRAQGSGLGAMSNQELAGELRGLAKRARGIGDRPLLGVRPLKSQMDRDLNAIMARRQQIMGEIQRRQAPSATTTPKITGGTIPTIGNSEAAAARKKAASDAKAAAREAARAEKEARARDRKFADDMSRAKEEQLRSQLDLTANQGDRVVIQQALLDAEHRRNVQAIQNDEHYTEAQKASLLQKEREAAALKSRVLRIEDQEKQSQIALDRARADADNESEILSAKANLARTAKERRDIELQLLRIQFSMLRAEQEKLRDDAIRRGDTEGQRASESRLRTLGTTQALATQDVLRRTQGPLGQLLDSVPRSAAEMDEALEAVAANGINSVVDGLTDAATGARSLADVFKNVANDIIRQLIRIAVQRAIVEPLANSLFSSGSAGSAGGNFFSKLFGAPKVDGARANGGPVVAGKSYWVGERGIERFTPSVSGQIVANDDLPVSGGRGDFHQHISLPFGTGLATREDMAFFASRMKSETLGALSEMQARRG